MRIKGYHWRVSADREYSVNLTHTSDAEWNAAFNFIRFALGYRTDDEYKVA